MKKMKTGWLMLLLTLLLVACGGGGEEPGDLNVDAEIDPDTGLIINPDNIPANEPFLVSGTISSLNLTPQTAPEFVVEATSGRRYRIRSQPAAEIFYEDGESLLISQFHQGMTVRATVQRDADTGLLVSDDLTIIQTP